MCSQQPAEFDYVVTFSKELIGGKNGIEQLTSMCQETQNAVKEVLVILRGRPSVTEVSPARFAAM